MSALTEFDHTDEAEEATEMAQGDATVPARKLGTKVSARRRSGRGLLALVDGGEQVVSRAALPDAVMDWAEPVEDWLNWLRGTRKPTTLKDYGSRLGLVRRWAEGQGLTLDQFKARHLSKYLAERQAQGLADTSRRHDAIVAKGFLKWACKEEYLRSDPLDGYAIPKAQTPSRYVPTAEEVGRLLQAIPDAWNPHKNPGIRFQGEKLRRFHAARDLAMISGLVATGARISELLALRLEDFRPDEGHIIIRHSKSGKPRTLPLSPVWQEAVEAYLAKRPRCDNPYLWISADGGSFDAKGGFRPIPLTTWERAWKRYMEQAGLSGWSRHNLRHYVGTYIAVEQKDLLLAQAMLGHADLKTTKIYLHNSAEQMKQAYQQADPLKSILVNTRSTKGRPKLL